MPALFLFMRNFADSQNFFPGAESAKPAMHGECQHNEQYSTSWNILGGLKDFLKDL